LGHCLPWAGFWKLQKKVSKVLGHCCPR
jgi:hypothetical protein